MKKNLLFCLLSLFCINTITIAQEDKKDKIAQAITDYFHLERENFHVHFDKTIFLSDEKIWFKGYTYYRKGGIPFFATTNIFATLMDDTGKEITTKLFCGSMGTFSGDLELGDSFKTGKYYIRFYTNWMNNFTEDESAIYELTIINRNTGPGTILAKPDSSIVNIKLTPEGGSLLKGISNTVGISVHGCGNSILPIASAELTDVNGKVITQISLNEKGYGRFDVPADATGYKVVVTVAGAKHEQPLPAAQPTGVALDVNSYAMADKTIIKIATNPQTLAPLAGQPLYMVIHQDDKAAIYDIIFEAGKTELAMAIPNSELFNGLNTLRILDHNLNQIAERLFYKHYEKDTRVDLSKTGNSDNGIEYKGSVTTGMNLSIAMVPQASISIENKSDIYGSLLLKPYLEGQGEIAGRYYLAEPTRAKKYELDLYLMNQKSKYNWKNILQHPPKSDYSFDIGLALKGKVNEKIINRKQHKMRVYSPSSMIDEFVTIDENNEFFLNNFIVKDSTKMRFELFEKSQKKYKVKLTAQISNNDRKFNKPFYPPALCPAAGGETVDINWDLPDYVGNTVVLDEVEVKGTATKLKYERAFGNGQLRPYKISEADSRNFFYILDFIRYHGFDVENTGISVGIYGRTVNTINGQRTRPRVYMDNMRVLNYDQLLTIQTADVDEFYINQHAIVPGVDNEMGMIKMYMKKNFVFKNGDPKTTFHLIEKGFQKIHPFENARYASYSDDGFKKFGLIDWQPLIATKDTGEFDFTVPFTWEYPVNILIEGISNDGKIVSEIKTIPGR